MKICASKLKVGTVVASGEEITNVEKLGGLGSTSKKQMVTLRNPKTGKYRSAWWNYWGTIFVNSVPNPEDLL
jgi:hypothetical protein